LIENGIDVDDDRTSRCWFRSAGRFRAALLAVGAAYRRRFGGRRIVAGIYLLLDAEFLAATQLVVYAGGTLVLIVFGVMLTSQSPLSRLRVSAAQTWAAAAVGIVLLVAIWTALRAVSDQRLATAPPVTAPGPIPSGTASGLGILLLGDYLIPFELASVILLVVMIGAAYLAKARRSGKPGKSGAV
jgi:NADH:ubiquinone oxidoreductase subunit 6 (subunit J)